MLWTTLLQVSLKLETAFTTGMFPAMLIQKSTALKTMKNGEFAHIVELSSIPMTLEVSWSLVTTSVALATSSREIRWFSLEEIQSIVRAMQGSMVAVLLVIGTAGTMPLTRLSISITLSSSGLRSLSATTASTSTHH